MKRHSILIVDDEVNLLKSLARFLKDEFHIHTAQSGKEGLMVLSRHPVSMILLDLSMPDMNGIEVLEEIRRKEYPLKVVIMTGRRDYDWSRRCADLAVNGFIEKPFHPEDMLKRMRLILDAKRCKGVHDMLGEAFNKKQDSISPTLKRTLSYIEANFPKKISREEIAEYLGISPQYLSRLFRDECGIQLKDFINKCKIEKALEHIKTNPSISIGDIAESVSISDPNYFCRLFKRHTGTNPTEFKKNLLLHPTENKE
ncbi:MAG: response regulator [bacterium]|nr:response regulator [bacterium]